MCLTSVLVKFCSEPQNLIFVIMNIGFRCDTYILICRIELRYSIIILNNPAVLTLLTIIADLFSLHISLLYYYYRRAIKIIFVVSCISLWCSVFLHRLNILFLLQIPLRFRIFGNKSVVPSASLNASGVTSLCNFLLFATLLCAILYTVTQHEANSLFFNLSQKLERRM